MTPPDPFPPADHPRPRVGVACAVVAGCGLAGLAAVAVLIYLAVTLFTRLGADDEAGGSNRFAPRPGPVVPTTLAKDRDTIKLPGTVAAVCRAAGGRYLVLHVPQGRRSQVVVFDPNTAAVVQTLDVDDPKCLIAGTASKLFVYRQTANRLDRYDLVTWERERSVAKPASPKSVDVMLAGPGSDGPVRLVGVRGKLTSADVVAVDADTLTADDRVEETVWCEGPVRVSHDGRRVGVANAGAGGGGVLLRFEPGAAPEWWSLKVPRSLGHLAPSPDGRWAYTAVGVYDPTGNTRLGPAGGYRFTLPAAHGSDLFVSADVKAGGATPAFGESIRLHLADAPDPAVAGLPGRPPAGVPVVPGPETPVAADLRVHLWPAAGLLAVLPATGQSIDVFKVDVGKRLRESRVEHLVIGSDPPTAAVRGSEWRYTPAVWSSRADMPTVMVSGPLGMGVSPAGELSWSVPSDLAEEVRVTVTVIDAGAKSAEQTFRVVPTDAAGP